MMRKCRNFCGSNFPKMVWLINSEPWLFGGWVVDAFLFKPWVFSRGWSWKSWDEGLLLIADFFDLYIYIYLLRNFNDFKIRRVWATNAQTVDRQMNHWKTEYGPKSVVPNWHCNLEPALYFLGCLTQNGRARAFWFTGFKKHLSWMV